MAERRIRIIIFICLILLFTGCNNQGQNNNPDIASSTQIVEMTGTALASSGVLKTPDFVLTTPSEEAITPSPTETPLFSSQIPIAVVMVSEDSELNIRSSPGDQNGVVAMLAAHALNISATGNAQYLDGETWIEVRTSDGAQGWVKEKYLTEQIDSTQFCADANVNGLVTQFLSAVQARDGATLEELISPRHGLVIRHEWWNPEVQYSGRDVLTNIFSDATSRDWGTQDGSGLPISGTFSEVILPRLDDVQADSIQVCNNLEQGLASGGSAGFVMWPYEYTNMNYVAIYRAAQEGDELNWRTWALGIEYVHGKPMIALLVQYHWEN